jgi:hypothetical protein
MTAPFQFQATTVLDGSGNGTVRLGPRNAGERWLVTGASVSVTRSDGLNAVNEPTFKMYRKDPVAGRTLGGSYSGSFSTDTSLNPFLMPPNDYVTGVWTGGDAGAVALLTLSVERRY